MGLMGSLEWVNDYGRKRCKSLFWKVRAAVKKALKDGANQKKKKKKQLKFHYDPSSYALNFDDGCFRNSTGDGTKKTFRDAQVEEFYTDVSYNTTWVYVVWIRTK